MSRVYSIQTVVIDVNQYIHDSLDKYINNELDTMMEDCKRIYHDVSPLVNADAMARIDRNIDYLRSLESTKFTEQSYSVKYVSKYSPDEWENYYENQRINTRKGNMALIGMFNTEYDWIIDAITGVNGDIHSIIIKNINKDDFAKTLITSFKSHIDNMIRRYNAIKHMFVVRNMSDTELTEWCETLNGILK